MITSSTIITMCESNIYLLTCKVNPKFKSYSIKVEELPTGTKVSKYNVITPDYENEHIYTSVSLASSSDDAISTSKKIFKSVIRNYQYFKG